MAKTPKQRVDAILEEAVGSDLNSWEKHEFLPSVSKRTPDNLTPSQDQKLKEIERKVFGDSNA
jgi:hypothetical protein